MYVCMYVTIESHSTDRGTQWETLIKRPKNNNQAWIELFEAILSILGDFWEKFICSSLPARLATCDLTYRRMSWHYWPVWAWVWPRGAPHHFSAAILHSKDPQTPRIVFLPATLSFQGHIITSTSPSQQKLAWRSDILRNRSIGCPCTEGCSKSRKWV